MNAHTHTHTHRDSHAHTSHIRAMRLKKRFLKRERFSRRFKRKLNGLLQLESFLAIPCAFGSVVFGMKVRLRPGRLNEMFD